MLVPYLFFSYLVANLYSNPFSAWILLAFILFIFLFLHLTKYRPFGNYSHSSPGSINFCLSRDFFFFFFNFPVSLTLFSCCDCYLTTAQAPKDVIYFTGSQMPWCTWRAGLWSRLCQAGCERRDVYLSTAQEEEWAKGMGALCGAGSERF